MLNRTIAKVVLVCVLFFDVLPLFAQHMEIKGKVYYNSELASGAEIILQPVNKKVISTVEGEFLINGLSQGDYTIKVVAGAVSEVRKITLHPTDTIKNIDFFLKEEEALNEIAILVKKEAETPDNFIKAKYSAMPVLTIGKKEIEAMGSRRLDEVMKEQTGIAIVNNIGGGSRAVGVQLQGFSSEYVLVLLNGQPLVGRNNENFDLSRISVTNIERIEVIKGASSSMYGSDAMGGIINIITKPIPELAEAFVSLNYGSFNALDAIAEASAPFAQKKGAVYIGGNYYKTDGFNTNTKFIKGVTAPPYENISGQFRLTYALSPKTKMSLTARYSERESVMEKDFGVEKTTLDIQNEKDLNVSLALEHRFSNRFKSNTRYYYTVFDNELTVGHRGVKEKILENHFTQYLHRFEQQFLYKSGTLFELVGGFGASAEDMENNLLTNLSKMYNTFAYIQGQWKIVEQLKVVGGLRFDHNNLYSGRLNPSLGLHYQPNAKLVVKAGIANGFKAPDFKKNYMYFFNASGNYYLIGNQIVGQIIQDMDKAGDISDIRRYVLKQTAGALKPEKSTSYNFSIDYSPTAAVKLESTVFYHNLENQINSIQVATTNRNQNVFTYQNLPKSINKGLTLGVKLRLAKNLNVNLGYQYLVSKDLSIADSIRLDKWPYNINLHNPKTGESVKPKPEDYWGLENRSRHMVNLNMNYTYEPWDITSSLRVNFRGKYPFGDANGNNFIDRYDHFVEDHYIVNATFEKKIFKKRLGIRLTLDNIFDYTNPLMPGQPGRVVMFGLSYRVFKGKE